jgi:hypothetical protein
LPRSSHTSSKLFALEMDECCGDVAACVPALAAVLRRNAPVRILELNASTGLGRDACRHIFDSLQDNTLLWSLEVGMEEVYDDALILPTNKASALRRLSIDVQRWTLEGKASLARKLKTNTLLKDLLVVHRNTIGLTHRPRIELLQSHNFTLRTVREQFHTRNGLRAAPMGDLLPRYLSRNGRIRKALDDLRGYHVSTAAPRPRVLEMVSGIPTLLYRFVRWGDINAWVDLVVAAHSSSTNKRSRPPAPPPPPRRSRRVAVLRK